MPVVPITKTPGQSGYDEELKAFSQSIADGLLFQWEGQWTTSTVYDENDGVYNDGSGYACILSHTSDATTEPGTGASWETYWSVMVAAGDMQKSIYDPTNKNGDAFDADNHTYSNATSGLTATNTQAAIDELALELVPSVMAANIQSKSEFEAQANRLRDEKAGSGFISATAHTTGDTVNTGIRTSTALADTFYIGDHINDVNGYRLNLFEGSIELPPAPGGSNPNLVTNGTFDTDTDWTKDSEVTIGSGVLTSTSTTAIRRAYQSLSLTAGKKYIAEFTITAYTAGSVAIELADDGSGTNATTSTAYSATGYYKAEFTAGSSNDTVSIKFASGTTASVDLVAVIPADEISRQDLVFLETWHEKVTDLDFIFPYGNVQYAGAEQTGMPTIATAAFTGYDTYSLFGNWQTAGDLVGKGHVWSTLTEAQKATFVSIAENNCYLDGTDVIQVRQRIRVIQGLGDEWSNADDTSSTLSYDGSIFNVQVKGKSTSIASDLANTANFTSYSENIGAWENTSATYSENSTYAVPIALVHRRNQGAYHPVWNPNGTKTYHNHGIDATQFWYEDITGGTYSATIPENIAFQMLPHVVSYDSPTDNAGNISSGVSGRPDGLYYDEINERDIIDMRMNANKINDQNREREKLENSLIAGTHRGEEGEYFTSAPVSGETARHPFDQINIPTYISETTRTKSNTLLHCDIIATAAVFDATFPDGVFGTWLPVDEGGSATVPTGTTGSDGLSIWKMSKKASATPLLVLESTDSGATWAAKSITTHYTFSTTTNTITFTSGNIPLTTDLVMIFYETAANPLESATNSEVVSLGDVWAGNRATTTNGSFLVSNLISKVPVGLANGGELRYPLTKGGTAYTTTNGGQFILWSTNGREPTHDTINLANSNPAVKMLDYLSVENGKAQWNVLFKEMVYDVTWGDDNTFTVTDNVTTESDDNGNTIIVGQKRVKRWNRFLAEDE